MVTKCCNVSTISAAAAANHTDKKVAPDYRISTKTLGNVLFVLNTTAAAIACYYNPTAALTGALCGAAVRHMVGDNPQATSLTEDERRANRIALMCLTTCATIYTGATFIPAVETTAAQCSSFAPFLVGFEGVTNGVYPLARKAVG